MDSSRRVSTRHKKSIDAGVSDDAAVQPDQAAKSKSVVAGASRSVENGKTRSARERAELAKTTRVLKSRLELALFKVGRGWEGVRFDRIEAAAQSLSNGSDTTSSSVDLSDAIEESAASVAAGPTSTKDSQLSSRASTSTTATTTTTTTTSTSNLLERSAGHQEQLNRSTSTQREDEDDEDDEDLVNHALLSPIKQQQLQQQHSTPSSSTIARQARSASISNDKSQSTPIAAPLMTSSLSSMPAFNTTPSSSSSSIQPPIRPATTRPSLDCNPPSIGRERSDSTNARIGGPLSAPPTTTTFSSPIHSSNAITEEFATPASSSSARKRQRRDSHQPKSSTKKHQSHRTTTISEEGEDDVDVVSSPPVSNVLNAAHLGHKRKVSQNTLWHQSRAILGGIGGGNASSSNSPNVPSAQQQAGNGNAFSSAGHPSPQSYLIPQTAASLTSPVRLKPGQARVANSSHGNAGMMQNHNSTTAQTSPYSQAVLQHQQQAQAQQLQQQQHSSPLGYAGGNGISQGQGSSVSPAASSSGGTVRGRANSNTTNNMMTNQTVIPSTIQTTPRRQSGSSMQNAPHTIAAPSYQSHHHQYIPHNPSNLGLASSSSSVSSSSNNNAILMNGGQGQMHYNGAAPGSTAMMQQQLSQQGNHNVLLQPQQQQVAYVFQSPQANGQQQQDLYGYTTVYAQQQPHIMQTPQHAQSNSHMMQHPHTAPQLQHHHHQAQQQGNNNMLTVSSYGTDYSNGNGMNVFNYADPSSNNLHQHPGQAQISSSYSQQPHQMQQQQGVYGSQMSPLNVSTNGFRNQQQQGGPVSAQMGQAMSMQGLPSHQQHQQHQQQQHMNMMRSQSAISRTPSELSTFTGSQPPPLDPSLLNGGSSSNNLNSSQESSSVDTNFSQQSAQAAQIVAAQMANAGTRPGTATGPERETAAELMLYLAASPSPQQPSKKVGNTALGGGDLSQIKGRKLFGGNDENAIPMQQNQQQQQQSQQGSQRNNSLSSAHSNEMSKSQSQLGMMQDHSNPFSVQHTYPGMSEQNQAMNMQQQQQQQMYNPQGGNSNASASAEMQARAAAQLAQPFEYNQAMQFDPYTMMTAQGVTLDQEFGSGW